MRFLIDECLSPALVAVANGAGYEAHHAAHLGLQAVKDWKIVPYAIDHDFVIVTRNSKDFRGGHGNPGLLTREVLHPGLICLNAHPMGSELMALLFAKALEYIHVEGVCDMLNLVLEIDYWQGMVEIARHETPFA